MEMHTTELDGALIIEPRVFGDQRGFFMETYHQPRYAEAGIGDSFVPVSYTHLTLPTTGSLCRSRWSPYH